MNEKKLSNEIINWMNKLDALNQKRAKAVLLLGESIGLKKKILKAYLKITIVIFIIDDLYDSIDSPNTNILNTPLNQLTHKEKNIKALVSDSINDLRLSEYKSEIIRKEFNNLISAMIEENNISSKSSVEKYISIGAVSIGAPLVLTVIYHLLTNETSKNDLMNLNLLNIITGSIIRILNDIRSYEKEVNEKKINIFKLKEINEFPSKKVIELLQNKFNELEKFDQLQEFRDFCIKMCLNVSKFYNNNDFHTYKNIKF